MFLMNFSCLLSSFKVFEIVIKPQAEKPRQICCNNLKNVHGVNCRTNSAYVYYLFINSIRILFMFAYKILDMWHRS